MRRELPIRLTLPEEFLNEEVRCGYKVSVKQKEIWAVEMDLIQELIRVCEKHSIHFQVFAGTLLGAVRHHGFIPWDDDLDVIFDRKNFSKLCRVADEFKHPYFLQTALTDQKFYIGYARLRNSLTTGVVDWERSPDYNGGIYVDLYVMDGVPAQGRYGYWVQYVLNWLRHLIVARCKGKNPRGSSFFKRIVYGAFSLFSYKMIVGIHDEVMSKSAFFSHRIGQMTHAPRIYQEHWITRDEFARTEFVDFEFIRVPASMDRRGILSRIYGDYLKFPPLSELGKWHEGVIHFDPRCPYQEYFKNSVPVTEKS